MTDEIYHWYEYQAASGTDDKGLNEMAKGSTDGIMAVTAIRMYEILYTERPSRWLEVLKERALPYDWYSIPEVAEFTQRAIRENRRQLAAEKKRAQDKEGAAEPRKKRAAPKKKTGSRGHADEEERVRKAPKPPALCLAIYEAGPNTSHAGAVLTGMLRQLAGDMEREGLPAAPADFERELYCRARAFLEQASPEDPAGLSGRDREFVRSFFERRRGKRLRETLDLACEECKRLIAGLYETYYPDVKR
ncbi:MAG: hypothetical protein IK083_08220 [Abditibacteriota bacterium]|nr:hypothetical protein [Abditibacteriota bacterium]